MIGVAAKLSPNTSKYQSSLGSMSLLAVPPVPSAALIQFNVSTKLDPRNQDALIGIIKSHLMLKEWEEAESGIEVLRDLEKRMNSSKSSNSSIPPTPSWDTSLKRVALLQLEGAVAGGKYGNVVKRTSLLKDALQLWLDTIPRIGQFT